MSGVHDRAGWNDPARTLGDALNRLLWPETYDDGPEQEWSGAADYLEVIASLVNTHNERTAPIPDEVRMAVQLGVGDAPLPQTRAGAQVVLSGRQVASLYGMRKAGRRFVLHVLAENPGKGDHVEIEASGNGRVKVCKFGPDGALRSTDR